MKCRSWFVFGIALALTLALPLLGRADGKDKDRPSQNWTVHFGQPQPQTPDANPPKGAQANGAQVTHFLVPNDLTIVKGDSVTFVVNGGGHGIAIHPVARKTTRADIAEDLCDGNNHEANDSGGTAADPNANAIANRHARSAVCNGAVVTGQTISGVGVIGTENLDYMISDGKNNLIIDTGANVVIPATTGPPPTPAIIVVNNPRVDDTEHTHRLLGTSGASPAGDTTGPAANRAGAFLAGSAAPATPGNRVQVQFLKTGRYLVICMNRGHSLNDHMFGFVNVVGEEGDD